MNNLQAANLVAIDFNNFFSLEDPWNQQTDRFKDIYAFFQAIYPNEVHLVLFAGVPRTAPRRAEEGLQELGGIGFEVHVIPGSWGKANADVGMAIYVMKWLYENPRLKHVVLFSGDRDFIPLLKEVTRRGIETTIIGNSRWNTSPELRLAADNSYLIDELLTSSQAR